MDYNYTKLLERAWEFLPEKLKEHKRLEIPEVKTFIEGNKTIIKNLNEISEILQRPQSEIFTYLLRELTSRGAIEKTRVVIQRPLRQEVIKKKIEDYANEFVVCKECGRPDTKIEVVEGFKILKCMACGAMKPVRKL